MSNSKSRIKPKSGGATINSATVVSTGPTSVSKADHPVVQLSKHNGVSFRLGWLGWAGAKDRGGADLKAYLESGREPSDPELADLTQRLTAVSFSMRRGKMVLDMVKEDRKSLTTKTSEIEKLLREANRRIAIDSAIVSLRATPVNTPPKRPRGETGDQDPSSGSHTETSARQAAEKMQNIAEVQELEFTLTQLGAEKAELNRQLE